ncbi:DUF4865 family protein [Kitasatospora sp. NBC_00315]|uniref:DUF4865 family protein n=1 Tax=Kitasatospora sp. NBC_00315 TaxID=2975963 RepID=UPI00325615EF
MQAMEYEITLPADYDMEIIRNRIATRGHLMDAYPGLGLKAYLVRERGDGVHLPQGTPAPEDGGGAAVNLYAPFYLWRTAEGMNSFLWGPGFRGIIADFGRPQVKQWVGAGLRRGRSGEALPTAATRHTERIPEGVDPGEAVERALAALPDGDTLHSAAVAVDPSRWEILHTALWHGPAPADAPGARYQVLHLSCPEIDALPAGRHW